VRAGVVAAVVVEGAHPEPLGAQQIQVDVGYRAPLPCGNRSVSASSTPFSQIMVWPSQARSVVDSPLQRRRKIGGEAPG